MQALPAGAESLCIVEQPFESGAKSALQLNIGLSNGVLLRTTLDSVSGDLADTRTRYVCPNILPFQSNKVTTTNDEKTYRSFYNLNFCED